MKALKTQALAAAFLLLACSHSHAAYTTYLYESGGDVVASGAGTLDTSSLGSLGSLSITPLVIPAAGILRVGTPGASIEAHGPVSGPSSLGPGLLAAATTGSGDMVAIFGSVALFAPQAYVSGSPLVSSATWSGTTLSALGLTPGDYTWAWGAGPSADSYTVRVGVAPPGVVTTAIPTLSSWSVVLMSGLLALAGAAAMRRKKTR